MKLIECRQMPSGALKNGLVEFAGIHMHAYNQVERLPLHVAKI